MDDPGDRIAQQARDLVRCSAFRAKFAEWTMCMPALGLLDGPESLLRLRRYPHHVREQVLASLVLLVQEDRQEASLLLLEVLRPGIGARAGWLRATHTQEEAWQELAACVLETVRGFDPDLSRNGIARDVLHQAWQKAGPKRRRHALHTSLEAALSELIEEESVDVWAAPLPSARALIAEAVESAAISMEEAALIRATLLDGVHLRDAAPGEPYSRIKKRRQRAMSRLKAFAAGTYPWDVPKRG